MSFAYGDGSDVTVIVSKNAGRYRLQSSTFGAMWLVLDELCHRLRRYYAARRSAGADAEASRSPFFSRRLCPCRISSPPWIRTTPRVWRAMESLATLSDRARQFRAAQKRLLVRFKDKNPQSLEHLDLVLTGAYDAVTSEAAGAGERGGAAFGARRSRGGDARRHAAHLVKFNLSDEDLAVLEAYLSERGVGFRERRPRAGMGGVDGGGDDDVAQDEARQGGRQSERDGRGDGHGAAPAAGAGHDETEEAHRRGLREVSAGRAARRLTRKSPYVVVVSSYSAPRRREVSLFLRPARSASSLFSGAARNGASPARRRHRGEPRVVPRRLDVARHASLRGVRAPAHTEAWSRTAAFPPITTKSPSYALPPTAAPPHSMTFDPTRALCPTCTRLSSFVFSPSVVTRQLPRSTREPAPISHPAPIRARASAAFFATLF